MRNQKETLEILNGLEPMIQKISNRYFHSFAGCSHTQDDKLEDIKQECRLAVLQAIQKFDDSRGVKFSSYAYFYINSAAQRYVESNADCLRTPHMKLKVASNRYESLDAMEGDDFLGDTTDSNDFSHARAETKKALDKLTPMEKSALLHAYHFKQEFEFKEALPLYDNLVRSAKNKMKLYADINSIL